MGFAVLLTTGRQGWGGNSSPPATAPSDAADFAVLSQDIHQAVLGLKYTDQVAQDFVDLVRGWQLAAEKRDLAQARAGGQPGRLPQTPIDQVEERIAGKLARTIRDHVGCSPGQFELMDVVRDETADCLGFTQVLYVLGNSLGLSVKAIEVTQLAGVAGDLPPGSSHVAGLVDLADGRMMMVDVATAGPPLVSQPFRLPEAFAQRGAYWELKGETAVAGLHRRIRLLDKDGLLACVYDNRGNEHNKQGRYAEALAALNTAIALDRGAVGAYNNRGIAWHRLGDVDASLADYSAAVRLDPKYGEAYYNRGNVHGTLGEFPEAIRDYGRAIELHQKYTWAYTNRGNAHFNLTRYREAIADHSKAVELDPNFAEAYSNRGNAYKSLGRYQEAIADHSKAIELNPGYAGFYINRAIASCRLGRTEAGKQDLRKAVELDPELKSRVRELGQHFRLNLGL